MMRFVRALVEVAVGCWLTTGYHEAEHEVLDVPDIGNDNEL